MILASLVGEDKPFGGDVFAQDRPQRCSWRGKTSIGITEPDVFPEPGLFVTNPDGNVQIVDISNAPFSRPELAGILRGIGIIQERDYPIRGTVS